MGKHNENKDKDTRFDRASRFLNKFNESDAAAELPFETKKKAFMDAEHDAANKEDKGK